MSYTKEFNKKYNDKDARIEGLIHIVDKKQKKPTNDLKLCTKETLKEVKEIAGV